MDETMKTAGANFVGGVKVDGIMDDKTVNPKVHDPSNPKADIDEALFITPTLMRSLRWSK